MGREGAEELDLIVGVGLRPDAGFLGGVVDVALWRRWK